MAEGDNKKNKRDTKIKAAHSADNASVNGDPKDGGFEEDTFGDEGFRQEGGTTHGTRRHRAQTLIIVGAIVLGMAGLAASFLLRDAATPAPHPVTPGATMFVTVGPTRTPRPPATPQPAPTFAPIDIQRADTPRQVLREISLADGQVGTNTSGKNSGLYSYDGRWLATLNAEGSELQLRGGPAGITSKFALPELTGASLQIYSWAPDGTALLLTSDLTRTQSSARQVVLARWDAASQTLSRTAIPISTTLDALTLGTDKNNLDDIAHTALAYWSPDGTQLAVVADAVLDDPPYNEDGSPRFRKLIQLFDRTGAPLGQFETSSDCCYWTPRNELMWWDARDPNAREYVFHSWSATRPIPDEANESKNAVHISIPYSPSGLWIVGSGLLGNESNQTTQLLVVELGEDRRLARVDFDNRAVIPLLDRLDKVTTALTSPDVPVTALRFTRVGADNTLWFYDWTAGTGALPAGALPAGALIAAGQTQQLGSWDAQLRGFTAMTAGQNAGTAQIELLDAASPKIQIDYPIPPQNLRAETSVLRPWPVNTLGFGVTPSPSIEMRQVSPDGRWLAQLLPISNRYNVQQWPADMWKTSPIDTPMAELVLTALDRPSLTFTQVFTLGSGLPVIPQWSPDNTAVAIMTLTSTLSAHSVVLVKVPTLSDESDEADAPFEYSQFELAVQSDARLQQPFYPVWSQDGATLIVGSDEYWSLLNHAGVEQKRIPRENKDRASLYLAGNLLLIKQGAELQAINLRAANLTRQTVYTWTSDRAIYGAGLTLLGVNADASAAIILEAASDDGFQSDIKRISLEDGTATTILHMENRSCCNIFSAGPSNQPLLGISISDGRRVLDEHIWFYDWDTGTLYDYNRPAKLLGWDAASKSFLLARRSADGFQVEAMQPLIQ